MGLGRYTLKTPTISHGSVEITDEKVIYTDAASVCWRLYDFARNGSSVVSVRPGSITASIRIYVRQDCLERRRAVFSPRDDTLTPHFNHYALPTSSVRRGGKWIETWTDGLAPSQDLNTSR